MIKAVFNEISENEKKYTSMGGNTRQMQCQFNVIARLAEEQNCDNLYILLWISTVFKIYFYFSSDIFVIVCC